MDYVILIVMINGLNISNLIVIVMTLNTLVIVMIGFESQL